MSRLKIGHIDHCLNDEHPALQEYLAEYRFFAALGCLPLTKDSKAVQHGTHIAGILSGISQYVKPNHPIGLELYTAGATEGANNAWRILKALDWLYEVEARVICLPFGLKGYVPIFQPIIDRLIANGALVIAAVGNDGYGNFRSPGCYPNVLGVGSCNYLGQPSDFSGAMLCYSTKSILKPEILVNGEHICSATMGKRYSQMSGTSQACAIVARYAIRCLEKYPTLTNEELRALIVQQANHPEGTYIASRYGVLDTQILPEKKPKNLHNHFASSKPADDLYLSENLSKKLAIGQASDSMEAILTYALRHDNDQVEKVLHTIAKKATTEGYHFEILKRANSIYVKGNVNFFRQIRQKMDNLHLSKGTYQ